MQSLKRGNEAILIKNENNEMFNLEFAVSCSAMSLFDEFCV